MTIDAASLAQRAAAMRQQGVVVTRPKSNFKVTTKHLGGKNTAGTDEEHDRAWWIEYEAQNRP